MKFHEQNRESPPLLLCQTTLQPSVGAGLPCSRMLPASVPGIYAAAGEF